MSSTKSDRQVVVPCKRAELNASTTLSSALIAANEAHIAEAALAPARGRHQHDGHHGHGACGPPPVRLLDKNDVLAITNVTFPTIWAWMRGGKFPRSRVVGGKSMWLSSEIDVWLAELPVRTLKGDDAKVEEVT